MSLSKHSSGDELKIGSVESDAWQVYRSSTVGRTLLDTLSSMESLGLVDRELSETALVLFDVAVRQWMANYTQTIARVGILRFWADKVVAYRHVDRQLKIVLKQAKVYMMVEADVAEEWTGKKPKKQDELTGVHLCDLPHMIIQAQSPFDRNVPCSYIYEKRPVQIVATVTESVNPWVQYFSFKEAAKK